MLEGSAPFSDTTPLEQLRRHLEGDFPGPEDIQRPLPGPVWALIERLVARNPEERAQSAQEVLLALRSLQRALEENRL
jgi:serine/threonine protein kinase